MKLAVVLNQNKLRLEIRYPALERGRGLKFGQRPLLFKGGVDFETAEYYHDLGNVLITGLDKLLKRNRITPNVIKSYMLYSDLGQDSTSYKVASAFVEALKFRDRN